MTDVPGTTHGRGNLTVYKASAGSGKTFTLTAEYIARLLEDEAAGHRHILAVTFTNKATAEMKERILQELWELANGQGNKEGKPTGFLKAVTDRLPYTDADTLRRRAAEALHYILHDYDYFRVETIDAFFQSLLSNLAHELGLSAGFKVDINDREVIDKAVDRLMLNLKTRPAVLSWVLGYIRERIDENKRWDITKEVKRLARQLMREVFLLHDEELAEALGSEKRLHGYRNELRRLAAESRRLMEQAAGQLDAEIRGELGGYAGFSRGSSLETYLRRIMEGNPEPPSATVLKYMDAPENWLRKTDRKRAELMEQAETLRGFLLTVEDLRDRGTFVINSADLSLRLINPLRLLNEINKEIADINHENNRFMLAKTPLLFNRLVGKEDASFVFEKSGIDLRHVMIDEFQDTSALQWSNFRHLFVENMAQGNGCLLVGDVKQGIYRFRNGDWNILAGIRREFDNMNVEVHDLETNFRSAERIVDFNNRFFSRAARTLDELSEDDCVSRLYDDAQQRCCGKPGGHVRVCLFPKSAKETDDTPKDDEEPVSMLDDLALQIETLHSAGTAYENMAILVRKNFMAADILSHFSEHHKEIPLISDEAFLLSSSPAVQLLVHALRYLADETDSIARAYIADGYSNRISGKGTDWTETIREGDRLLPAAFITEREKLLSLPLYELCERLSVLFGLEKSEEDAPYLFYFFDQVLVFLDDQPSDIRLFLAYWDDTLSGKSIPAGEVAGIRILTIHKSKGLAFHTVLLPFCDWPLEKDRQDDMLWCVPSQAPYNELPLVPVPLVSGKSIRQSIYAKDYEHEHLQRRIENLNLMYVAFTRAKENLYIWADTKEKILPTPTMGDVIHDCLREELQEKNGIYIYEYGTNGPAGEKAADSNRHKAEKAFENPLKAKPIPEFLRMEAFEARVRFRQSNGAGDFVSEPADEAACQQAEYIERGKLLHHLLSAVRTPADIGQAIEDLRMNGIIGPETDTDQLSRFIKKRLSEPVIADWFGGSWKLYNECVILTRGDDGKTRTRRPDRVMVRGTETVVVDFKFGNPRPEHAEQVREYIDLLRRMGHSDVSGYLWYAYTGVLEPVSPNSDLNPKKK